MAYDTSFNSTSSTPFRNVTSTSDYSLIFNPTTGFDNMTSAPTNAYIHLEEISVTVRKICDPVLFLVGTIGNLLTILVLSQNKNRRTTTAIFLIFLAISDIMILFTSYFSEWLYVMWSFGFRQVNNVLCKLHVFLTYYSLQFSSWTLVIVTCERVISVINQLK